MSKDLRVVIAGGGRVGMRTAEALDGRGHDIVVIEPDEEQADAVSDAYVATVINGDATRPSVLEQGRLEQTDVVAALTGKTGTNLAVCMAAQRLTDEIVTVMRTDREGAEEYEGFVDEVIFPERAGARAAANAIERDILTFEEVTGNLELLQIQVTENAPVAGKSLAEVALPRGSLIVSDADGDRIAGSETVLEPGRFYVLATELGVADEVRTLFQG